MFIATFEKCFFTLFIPNMVLIRMIHVTIINNLLPYLHIQFHYEWKQSKVHVVVTQ